MYQDSNFTIQNTIHLLVKPQYKDTLLSMQCSADLHQVMGTTYMHEIAFEKTDIPICIFIHFVDDQIAFALKNNATYASFCNYRYKVMTPDMLRVFINVRDNLQRELNEYLLHPKRISKWINAGNEIEDYMI